MYQTYLESNNSKICGAGVFCSIDLPTETCIAEITGEILDIFNGDIIDNNFTQIGYGYFLNQHNKLDLNHSCNPNCYLHIVGKRVLLYSLYFIKANTELTLDYSLTSTDDPSQWSMDCLCKDFNCRKKISGFTSLPETNKNNYEKLGVIPLFLNKPRLFIR